MLRVCVVMVTLCGWLGRLAATAPAEDAGLVEIATRIDAEVRAGWEAAHASPAEPLNDGAYLRRVMLDLAGRVPTVPELQEYETDNNPEKRPELVTSLLAAPDFAFHQRNELDLLLLARLTNNGEWRDYLLTATRENRPWDQLFREIVLPDVHCPDTPGVSAFLRERVRELDDLTNDTAVLFFGVNIGCAKCHDHPHVPDWRQDHYYGMASFFQRTYRTKKGQLAEKFDGRMNFKTVAGDEKAAQFMFLTGASVDEPLVERTEDEQKELQEAVKKAEREDDAEIPTPEFRPRAELVRLALEDGKKRFLAKNIVNRTWARLMGRGLVHPLDQLHSENPASHPDLLDWLARDLEQHGYDLARLIGGIVLSDAYALSSRWPSGDRPDPALFAVAEPRALTPRQLALSTIVATLNPKQSPGLNKPDDWSKRREDWENRSNHLTDQLAIPEENFQVSVEEALLYSNNDHITREYLRASDDRLIGAIQETEGTADQAELLYCALLGRAPSEAEEARIYNYVDARSDRSSEAWSQILWAVLTSPEFRFNH
ncbi:MAG: DUF1549 domain-containing protein [Planctomycetaceae bacterium]|nr:DUF1549 domain-containing protein [Planctomycetaceae bacterium]